MDKTVCDWVSIAGLEVLALLDIITVEICDAVGEASRKVGVENVDTEVSNRVDIEEKPAVIHTY